MQIVTVRRTDRFTAIVFDPHTTGMPIILVPTADRCEPRHYALLSALAGERPGNRRPVDDLLSSLIGRDCPDAALTMLQRLAADPAIPSGTGAQLLADPRYASLRDLLTARTRLGWPLAIFDLARPRPATRAARNPAPRQIRAALERAQAATIAA